MEHETLTVKGMEFKIERIPSNGKRAVAEIHGNTIKFRIPIFLDREEAYEAFLELRKKMIKSLEKKPRDELGKAKPPFIEFHDGQEVNILDRAYTIKADEGGAGLTSSARLYGKTIRISLANGIDEAQRRKAISILSRRVISRAVLPVIKSRVNELNKRHFGFEFNNVALKDQMTRWGSCSSEGRKINLSFRLLFAPDEILDYVIVHELAHLKEHNHSRDFWNLVSSAVPDHRERRGWLKKNGTTLGPSSYFV